jgi:predicted transcriptional regulator
VPSGGTPFQKESQMEENTIDIVTLAAELTAAWLGNSNTRVSAEDVPAFLKAMHASLSGLSQSGESGGNAPEEPRQDHVGAVTARKSLASPAHLISMIDGKPYKTLRRHLSGHGLSPEEYRARYGLKSDYPMVAPDYSEARRAMAKKIGLGRKPGETVKVKAAVPTTSPVSAKTTTPPIASVPTKTAPPKKVAAPAKVAARAKTAPKSKSADPAKKGRQANPDGAKS